MTRHWPPHRHTIEHLALYPVTQHFLLFGSRLPPKSAVDHTVLFLECGEERLQDLHSLRRRERFAEVPKTSCLSHCFKLPCHASIEVSKLDFDIADYE